MAAALIIILTFFVIKNPYNQIHMITLALSVLGVALASIGINLHNRLSDDKKDDDEVKSNYTFLIIILIANLVTLIGSFVLVHPKAKNALGINPNWSFKSV